MTDTGPGIPAMHRERIFDRFYRIDSGRSRDTGGVGLGLSTAAEIIRFHEGTINVMSQPGGGTVIRVVFPGIVGQAEPPEPEP